MSKRTRVPTCHICGSPTRLRTERGGRKYRACKSDGRHRLYLKQTFTPEQLDEAYRRIFEPPPNLCGKIK